jgi:hypothetical protein
MSIPVSCGQCGWKAAVEDELAGKTGKCPTCGELILIPKKGAPPPVPTRRNADVVDDADIVEDEPRSRSTSGSRPGVGSKARRDEDEDRPRRRRDEDDDDDRPSRSRRRAADDDEDDDRPSRSRRRPVEDDDDDDRPRTRRRAREDDYDDDDDRPRRRRRKAEKKPEPGGWFGLEKGILNGGVIGGAIAMLVAVVWFVIGLMADWIFFYPPILFLIGLVAFIKGLVSGGDE